MAQHYKNTDITKSRVKVFLGWENFNAKGNVAPNRRDQNLCSRLWTSNSRESITLSVASPSSPLSSPTAQLLDSFTYLPAVVGDKFGPTFATHVFRLDVVVPQSMHNCQVHLLWDSNSEALVLDQNGVPRQGLVGGNHWARRADYKLFPDREQGKARGGDKITLYIEIACNGLFGAGRGGDIEPPDMDRYYTLEECCIAVFNPSAWSLIHDLTILSSLSDQLPNTPRRAQAIHVANEVVNAVRVDDLSTYGEGRRIASQYLSSRNGDSQSLVYSMLHAHIDLAWLWPMASTPGKAARTISTQLRLMDEYPECIYVQSQAQLYAWVKDHYPTLWTQICARVKEGRLIPAGATWVEMDCNLPSGESLLRQFLQGQKFFLQNFGRLCNEFWLPDTFGYSAQLPQIMKGCRVDNFLTQKLSWNLFNKFPHSTFIWEGLDGSRVFAHMPPADTYNAQAFPEEVIRTAYKNKDCSIINSAVMLVGHGDGGGGASPSMIESMRRMQDLDGVPKVQFSTPGQFFDHVKSKAEDLPRWVGELYFELHRGTYTSQARTKRDNRWCETLLRDTESVSAHALMVSLANKRTFDYPAEMLQRCWQLVLKNCFHDTLPGSCIGLVYKETDKDYNTVKQKCSEAITEALDFIATSYHMRASNVTQNGSSPSPDTSGDIFGNEAFLLERGTGWLEARNRVCIVEMQGDNKQLPSKWFSQQANYKTTALRLSPSDVSSGTTLLALKGRRGGWGIERQPQMMTESDVQSSLRPVRISKKSGPKGMEYILSNENLRATIASSGRMTNLILLSKGGVQREALATEGEVIGGNKLVVYDDVPQFWCGWDTEVYAFEKSQEVGGACKCEIIEEGPLRVAMKLEYPATNAGSVISQVISLRAGSARLDFTTDVDWKESRKILRVLFETNIRSSYASYDSQFGFVRRPTTFNHSWEIAKFEVVGHQYCDLSEYGFGLALLNDCKYGYSVRDSTMRLSLLRAPKSPDDNADIGQHRFTYSLLPHWKSFPTREVLEEAADLNWPPYVFTGDAQKGALGESEKTMFGVSCKEDGELDSVVISAVKQAEQNESSIVVRLYEGMGARGIGRLVCPRGVDTATVQVCNMLEEAQEVAGESEVRCEGEDLLIKFKPFEVRTLKMSMKGI